MRFLITGLLLAAAFSPLIYAYLNREKEKKARLALFANIVSVFAVCLLSAGFALVLPAAAADGAGAAQAAKSGLAYIGAAVAVGLSCLGGGIAVASAASAALGAISENPKIFGQALIMVVLAEGIAIYGMLIAVLILNG